MPLSIARTRFVESSLMFLHDIYFYCWVLIWTGKFWNLNAYSIRSISSVFYATIQQPRNFNEKENSGILILSNIYAVFWINAFIFITGLHILYKIRNERIINGVIQIEQATLKMIKFWIETVCFAIPSVGLESFVKGNDWFILPD